jgi:tyrosine-protein kinase Etk/Wzc
MNHRPSPKDQLDLRKLVSRYRSLWYVFAICVVLGLAGAHMINTIKQNVYRVRSVMLIHEDRTVIPLLRDFNMLAPRNNFFNEAARLESFTLIDSVLARMDVEVSYYEAETIFGLIRRTEVYPDSPFRVQFDKGHLQPFGQVFTIKVIDGDWYELAVMKGLNGFDTAKKYFFGEKLEGEGHSFTINMAKYESDKHRGRSFQFVINDMHSLTEMYWEQLTIMPLRRESSIVEITFEATNLQRAQDFVNTLTRTFNHQNLHYKNHTAQNTIRFIDEQIALTSGNLQATEGRLQNFREKQQLMDIGLIATQLMNQLEELDKERSMEEVKRRYYNFLQEYVSDARDFSEVFGPSALGIDDPLLNNLVLELSNLHTERGRLRLTTTERSPSVVAVDQNIKQVKATMAENIRSIRSASDIKMSDLNARISRIEGRISELPSTERELMGIQRMFNITDATYNFLLEKQAEAGISLASNLPDHIVIDPARFDRIVAPAKEINYALGFLLTFILPLTVLGLRDYFNTRIRSKEDVTRALTFPVVGLIPRYKPLRHKEVDVVIFDQPFSPITEAFRSVRSNLHFFSPKTENNLIVVTSTRSGEGKTFTAVNLAGALAMANKRTLYIDADVRKTHPNRFTQHMIDVGLSNYLIGQAKLEDIINPSRFNENMYIMNSGIRSPNPAELIESQVMMRLLEEKLNKFEYIIIDTSPVGLVADAQPLMTRAMLNLFVIRHNFSQYADLDFIRDYSIRAGLKNIVVTINDVKRTPQGYGYGYGHGYGFGYGYNPEMKKNRRKKEVLN